MLGTKPNLQSYERICVLDPASFVALFEPVGGKEVLYRFFIKEAKSLARRWHEENENVEMGKRTHAEVNFCCLLLS